MSDPAEILREKKTVLLNEYQANRVDLTHIEAQKAKLEKRQEEIEVAVCRFREAIESIEAADKATT